MFRGFKQVLQNSISHIRKTEKGSIRKRKYNLYNSQHKNYITSKKDVQKTENKKHIIPQQVLMHEKLLTMPLNYKFKTNQTL